jgi:hypothetical protein
MVISTFTVSSEKMLLFVDAVVVDAVVVDAVDAVVVVDLLAIKEKLYFQKICCC